MNKDDEEIIKRRVRSEGITGVRKAALAAKKTTTADVQTQKRRDAAVRKAGGEYVAQPLDLTWALAAHTLPEQRRCLVTPEQAQTILNEANTHNRRRTPREKARLWRKIQVRGWQYTHQGIAFDSNGVLIDGQLRCAIAVEQNLTLDVNVSVGMSPGTFYDVDTGDPRTAAQALSVEGEIHVKQLQGAVTLVYWYEQSRTQLRNRRGRYDLTNEEVVNLVQNKYGDTLRFAVAEATHIYLSPTCPKFPIVPTAAAIYLIQTANPYTDLVTEFIRGIRDGTNITDTDIRGPFRTYWYNMYDTRHGTRVRPRVEDALGTWLKAWEMWVENVYRDRFAFPKTSVIPAVARVE